MNKPKLLINIIPMCPENKTIFIGKRIEDLKLNFISGKLKYGEEFLDAVQRIIKEELGLLIQDLSRAKFVCSTNTFDKDKSLHFVSIIYYIILNEDEVKNVAINKYTFSSYVFATIEDLLNYKDETYLTLNYFLNTYKIASIDDIKNILSN